MPRRLAQYLADILASIDHILEFTSNMDRKQYESSYLIQSAVERQFITMGEAVSKIREYFPEVLGSIDDTNKIVAFRNVLVHDYENIDGNDVWSALSDKLPVFREQIVNLLNAK